MEFDNINSSFDTAVEKVENNGNAIKEYNKEKYQKEIIFIENYLQSVSEKEPLFAYIQTFQEQNLKREDAKQLRNEYEKGFNAFFKTVNLDTCSFSDVINILNSQDQIISKNEEIIRLEILEEKERLIKRKQQEFQELVSCVYSWESLYGRFHFSYLLNYYPIKCDFEATKAEWDDRWTVWNFKNTPGKIPPDDHEEALETVIPQIKSKLISTFGILLLKKITLVCIPASSAVKTKARYEDFSRRICQETAMANAFDYMQVTRSSEEKKLGGIGIITDNVSFDSNFFRDRFVLLFDDVITKGDSMLRFAKKMSELGAHVIGGMSIGKTKHNRP